MVDLEEQAGRGVIANPGRQHGEFIAGQKGCRKPEDPDREHGQAADRPVPAQAKSGHAGEQRQETDPEVMFVIECLHAERRSAHPPAPEPVARTQIQPRPYFGVERPQREDVLFGRVARGLEIMRQERLQ